MAEAGVCTSPVDLQGLAIHHQQEPHTQGLGGGGEGSTSVTPRDAKGQGRATDVEEWREQEVGRGEGRQTSCSIERERQKGEASERGRGTHVDGAGECDSNPLPLAADVHATDHLLTLRWGEWEGALMGEIGSSETPGANSVNLPLGQRSRATESGSPLPRSQR